MQAYRAFGLKIRSDFDLPELTADTFDGEADVVITEERLGVIAGLSRPYHEFSPGRQILAYPEVGAFVIEGQSRIRVEPTPGIAPGLIAFPLLGPVMGLLLHLRGHLVLHASAVQLNGNGIGFLGDKGAGKSTLATSLLKQQGTVLLTDDLMVFDDKSQILASFPQVKLAPDALRVADGMNMSLRPPPIEDFPKHQLRLAADAPLAPVRAAALYELRRASRSRVEPMSPSDALKVLLRFCYIARFPARTLGPAEQSRLFQQAARLATIATINRLYVPETLEDLSLAGELLAEAHRPQ